MEGDWGPSWDFSEMSYPGLPKAFTGKKAAKKRKHRELYVTEEQLQKPVKLQGFAGSGSNFVAVAQPATVDGEGPAQKTQNKSKQQQQQPSPGPDAVAQAAAAQAEAAVAVKPHKKQKPAGVQQQEQQQQGQPSQVAQQQGSGAQTPTAKKSKNKFKQQQQQPHNEVAQQQGDGGQAPAAKKSKNKFKQQQQQQDAGTGQAASAKATVQGQKAGMPESASSKAAPSPLQQTPQSGKSKKDKQQQQPKAPEQKQQQKQKQQEHSQPASKQQKHNPRQQQQPQAAQAARGGSSLLDKMRAKLAGGRFRQLNETLYTQPGEEAYSMMQQQPELFEQYHTGFKAQVASWPLQPQDAAIAWVKALPKGAVVADFGCGDARLAASVPQKVHSLDLVASAPKVIACNMAHTPLAAASCDAAVFSLALMGTDYGAFLQEAGRVLKEGGQLWIAEVRSRFATEGSKTDSVKDFVVCLKHLGFKLRELDASNTMFVILVLDKVGPPRKDPAAVKWPELHACVYKKR